ncbi:MAG: AmmeMemoRadiSam system radical SAM enzyme [Clostridia bacterium]|jgi:pyruvate formate lyase activating enzyme|nr:AmmeMemoRadiSam system radical SAM enzyme [Clostridia bacterium]
MDKQPRNRKEASFYKPLAKARVRCLLCPHKCLIHDGEVGFCRSRINKNGKLYVLNYAWISALALEPMERLPLKNFYDGMGTMSIGSFGCNMACSYCENHQLVASHGTGRVLYPDEIANIAAHLLDRGNIGIAYTYGEPVTWYEYVMDTAKESQKYDLKNIMVSNGFINKEPLIKLLPYIDAFNIDIKSMRDDMYSTMLKGDLASVLNTCKTIKGSGKHLEITSMLITDINTNENEIEALAAFIADELGKEVPLHFWGYLPNGKLSLPPTSFYVLEKAANIATRRLDNVYVSYGNNA